MSGWVEFIEARLAEVEGAASHSRRDPVRDYRDGRIEAMAAALRMVVGLHDIRPFYRWGGGREAACSCGFAYNMPWPCPTIAAIAAIWADHEDYPAPSAGGHDERGSEAGDA